MPALVLTDVMLRSSTGGIGPQVRALADDLARAHLHIDPFEASYMGVDGYNDAVPDLSLQRRQAWRDELVTTLLRVDQLEADDLDDRLLLRAMRDDVARALAGIDSRVEDFTVTTFPKDGPSRMLFVAARARVDDPPAASDYLSRCRKFSTYLAQKQARLLDAAEAGLLPVAPLVQNVITQVRNHLADPSHDPLLGHEPPAEWGGASEWRSNLERVVTEQVRPALAAYLDTLVEMLPRCRPGERAGLVHVPGGVAAYACCIRQGTTLPLSADELHQIGLAELAKTEEKIAELGRQVVGERGVGAVLDRLRRDPAFAVAPPDAMARAAATIERAEERMADLFRPPLPDACTVQPMPVHMASSGAPPMYLPPARDASGPGVFLFNQADPGAAGSWAREAAVFHEAVPGHHAQFSRMRARPDLPLLLDAFVVIPHAEGWGLYAERLADEFGLYSDGVQRLGLVVTQAWRAARLVIDTGLHDRGWARAQAYEFCLAHTALPEPFVAAEVDRYIAWPGQALGYLIGELEILRLRQNAQDRLGLAYDVRDFHSAVLDHGSLPLPVLAAAVDAWVQSTLPEPSVHTSTASQP